MSKLDLQCQCGAVKAAVKDTGAGKGLRVVCYCRSCQAFAHQVGRPEALDAQGGTDIFMTSPANLEFTEGKDKMASVRLTAEGPLRWYATCCNTPLGATPAQTGFPFLGLTPRLWLGSDGAKALDTALGEAQGAVFADHLKCDKQLLVKGGKMPKLKLLKAVRVIGGAKLRGDSKRSAFRNNEAGTWMSEPRMLSDAEREALYQKVGEA